MGSTRRTKRLGHLIQAELALLILRKVKDPRVAGVTLTGVDVSPDLSQAKVYYSLLDPEEAEKAQAGMEASAAYLRRELAARLQLKSMPTLMPVYDSSLVRGAELEQVIRKAREEDLARAAQRGDEPDGETDEDRNGEDGE